MTWIVRIKNDTYKFFLSFNEQYQVRKWFQNKYREIYTYNEIRNAKIGRIL